ncbi:MAG: glycosyltransferase [Bacteroidales bacterium]|nr:glycosyltransferase [Bacteroidales bacterium]
MRILHITNNYPSERNPAFGSFVQSQVASLQASGVDCAVFFVDGRGCVWRYLRAWMRLVWHLLTHRYDVLHCHHALTGLLLCLTGAPLFSRCVLSYQNSPSYEWGRGTFFLLYPFFRRFILKFRDEALSGYKKVCVIPNGCSPERFRPMDKAECRRELGLEPEGSYVLFIDANARRAAKKHSQKRRDRFDVALIRLCECLGKPVHPMILQDEDPLRMPLWYNAADLFLLTSDYEGSPNAVKECLMCNTPVVATPVGDLPYLAKYCPDCHVVPDFDPNTLAQKAWEVMTGVAGGPGQTSRDALLKLGYGLEDTASKLVEMYRGL